MGRVVEALSLPLAGGPVSPRPEAPREAHAYELYLRANALAQTYEGIPAARDLYQQCLELDPRFAPAWAQLGRCHYVIGKYIARFDDSDERAEEAFRRALELSPRLSVAHKFYANFEAGTGHAREALARLLGEAERHGNDPELFAGLVHACRYCGLYEQSITAHDEARRLDPTIITSVEQTVLMTEDLDRILEVTGRSASIPGYDVVQLIALGFAGRREEARRELLKLLSVTQIGSFRLWGELILAWLNRSPEGMMAATEALSAFKIVDDPEAIFHAGWSYCDLGEFDHGLELVRRAVERGYCAAPTLSRSRVFDPIRSDPGFQEVLAQAVACREKALVVFREHGGERLLGNSE